MGERKINLSEKADEDLREIFNYVSENSLSAALAKIDLILARIELLKNFPRLGRVVQHFKKRTAARNISRFLPYCLLRRFR